MKKFFYRFLVITLAIGIAVPAWVNQLLAIPSASAASADIIIDNGDAGYTTAGGASWITKTAPADNIAGYDNDADVENSNPNSSPAKTARWTPNITVSGAYDIYVYYSVGAGRPTNAPYTISYDGGTVTVNVDQTKDENGVTPPSGTQLPSGWIPIGTQNLASGSYVELRERAAGNTCADAVRFVHTNVAPAVPTLSTPANGSTIEAFIGQQALNWSASTDADDSTLQYQVKYDGTDQPLTSNLYHLVNVDLGSHTWQVRAFDGEDYSAWSVEWGFDFVDTTAPEIILNPDNPMTIQGGTPYVEPGATASDTYRGNLTSSIVISSTVNTSIVGSYTVTYDVSDGINPDHKDRTVYVVDTLPPAINSVTSSPPNTTGENATIDVDATDHIGITSALISINGSGYNPLGGSEPNYSYSYNLPKNSLGTVSYDVCFNDAANNGPTCQSGQIYPVDNDEPDVTSVTGTTGTTEGNTLVTVLATDNIAPTAGQISFDGGSIWLDMIGSASPFTYSVPIPSNSVASIDYVVRVRDAAGLWSDPESRTITVTDNNKPINGSIIINSGATYTNNTSVNLTLYAEDNIGVVQMSFRNGTSGGWSSWETYSTSKTSWLLPTGDGEKTVQAKYRDAAGKVSNIVSDTITFEKTNPVSKVDDDFQGDLYGPNSTPVWPGILGGTYDDQGTVQSGVDRVLVTVIDPNSDILPGFNEAVATLNGAGSWTLNIDSSNFLIDGTYTVKSNAIDNATNPESLPDGTGTFIWDKTGPTVKINGNDPISTYGVAAAVEMNDDHNYTATLNGEPFVSDTVISNNGSYKLVATDKVGNKTEVNFVIDIPPTISAEASSSATETSITITWTTDQPSTSRVVYDIVSHAGAGLSGYPTDGSSNYGYAYSTVENSTLVKNHSVTITGLTAGTTYFYRTISAGSPEKQGSEYSFKTSNAPVATVEALATTAAVSSTSTAPSSTVSPTTTTSTETPTGTDNQGEVKAAEDSNEETEDSFNWTPWIILIIIIALAGAATGGYFYWTRGEDLAETKVTVNSRKTAPKKSAGVKKNNSPKKINRW